MSGLGLDVDLDKIGRNAQVLVDRAAQRGVSITAVTKALLGEPRLARVLVSAGVDALGDSRIENIETMRSAGIDAPMVLVRSPVLSQVDRVVGTNAMSVNSEATVLTALARSAQLCGRVHEVIVMVESGDLRDGVMPVDLHAIVRHIVRLPSLRLAGIGTNLACRHGVEPTDDNMAELTRLVEGVESTFGIHVDVVSGGNSANLGWLATTEHIGRINNLRLGESILLGRNPLDRQPIDGLHTDAIALVGEVIESQRKPRRPWGRSRQNAFGETLDAVVGDRPRSQIWQTLVAVGRQDLDPDDLSSPPGVIVLGASSDHLVLETAGRFPPGSEVRFVPGYTALLRAATSPFVEKRFRRVRDTCDTTSASSRRQPAVFPSARGRALGATRQGDTRPPDVN